MTINEAIYKVLMTQFKKDIGAEALTLIKEAGYEIFKDNGNFNIKNPKTGRYVYIGSNSYNLKVCTYGAGFNRYYPIGYKPENCKFDFAGYLEKPLNTEWYSRYIWANYHPTEDRYRTLYNARNTVRYEIEHIARIKKQISDLQADLERSLEYKIKKEISLKDTRRELGLIK